MELSQSGEGDGGGGPAELEIRRRPAAPAYCAAQPKNHTVAQCGALTAAAAMRIAAQYSP